MAVALSKTLHKALQPAKLLLPLHPPLRNLSSSAASSRPQEKGSRGWPKWILFLPGAVTFGLGTWQIFRRQEKMQMLDYRMKRLEMDPVILSCSNSSDLHFDSLEFRKVLCKGFLDESKSIFVGPRSRSISGVTENGYFIITPLMPLENVTDSVQSPVLVNRGWVPRSWRDKYINDLHVEDKILHEIPIADEEQKKKSWWQFWSKKSEHVQKEIPDAIPVEVIGVVRGSEKPSIFVPSNDSTSGQWFYINVPEIAHACRLPENTLYVEDINENVSASQPYPVPKDVNTLIRYSVMPQDHLNYIITWYSLSAAVMFMAVKRLKAKGKFYITNRKIPES